ncbi:hypothetical protein NDA17_001991 [Ustilago hordei]|nr:hypothetical protein NDA17_001991 [Ustilago hordei]
MTDEVYGTPIAPKEGNLLEFAITGDNKQVISPLSIMIEAMRTRVNNFLANKEWDANHILVFKIEGPFEQQHHIKMEMPAPVRADTPISAVSNFNCHHLVGCDATPGPTPELSTITNHHLKVLSSLNEKMHSIIMQSFSNKLHIEYFAEHGDKLIPIAVDLFDWAMNKCKAHSTVKEYELSAVTLDLHWDQVGSHAYDFLVKWEAHVSELHEYLQDPWKLDYCYRTLKRALPSDRNALFNSVFILHEKIHGREQTIKSISDVLCQCYKLAAEITPTSHCHVTEESELTALQATTLINCWDAVPVLAFFTEVEPAPINLPPQLVPFVFDSGASCVMVNCTYYGKGWQDMEQRMMYQNCLLMPNLVTNLIGTKSITHAQGKVIFENELVTIQDKHGHAIQVPTTGDGYPTAAMLIWDNSMPEPAISLAFAAEMVSPGWQCRNRDKAALWHCCLGHASLDATLHMRTITLAHDIPSSSPTHPDILCDICIQSKATARTPAHPRCIEAPLELVSMDVMGPLHGATKFAYVLIIHDAYSSMIWMRGLTNKSQASQEAAWWFSGIRVATCQVPLEVTFDHGLKEVCIDQGELWSNTFHNLCSSTGVKVTAAPTQQHLDNAFTEQVIQTIQKIAQSILYNANLNEHWWPYAISQATFIHNWLAGTTRRNLTPFELFYGKCPELHQL